MMPLGAWGHTVGRAEAAGLRCCRDTREGRCCHLSRAVQVCAVLSRRVPIPNVHLKGRPFGCRARCLQHVVYAADGPRWYHVHAAAMRYACCQSKT